MQQAKVSKDIIEAIEKQLQRREEDQVEALCEELDSWQQKYFQLEKSSGKMMVVEMEAGKEWEREVKLIQVSLFFIEAETQA